MSNAKRILNKRAAEPVRRAHTDKAEEQSQHGAEAEEGVWTLRVRNTFLEARPADAERRRRQTACSAPPRMRQAPSHHKAASPSEPATDMNGKRTTVVVRGVPHELTRAQLLQVLDREGYHGKYDFVYLPIEFNKGTNFGYAFVDFISPQWSQSFMSHFHNFTNWLVPCQSESNVVWSSLQNLENHIERYRNSPVMHPSVADECKPIMLSNGVRVKFPEPTTAIPLLRRLRTQRGSVKSLRWDTNVEGKPCLNSTERTPEPDFQGPQGVRGRESPSPTSPKSPISIASTVFGSDHGWERSDGCGSSSGGSTPPPEARQERRSRRQSGPRPAAKREQSALLLAPLLASPKPQYDMFGQFSMQNFR